jgi:hypothetical protein
MNLVACFEFECVIWRGKYVILTVSVGIVYSLSAVPKYRK